MLPSISVVVATFQRERVVASAVRSALGLLRAVNGQVVVVDDASSDGTVPMLRQLFAAEISSGTLALVVHSRNGGVTAAKNSGFAAARGDWVAFLDSDDELLANARDDIVRVLSSNPETPLIFFRCVDEAGVFVGRRFDAPQALPLDRYLRHVSYGEALVVINKRVVDETDAPFDADLRGYEGLGCARIIKRYGAAVLSDVVARRYDRSGGDRLSSSRVFLQRAGLVGQGHLRLIRTFRSEIPRGRAVSLFCKAVAYQIAGTMSRMMEMDRG